MSKYYTTSETYQKDERKSLFFILFLGGALLFAFGWIANNRLIARDEGFYTLAAQLVLGGAVPYRDFFYPQMPLLPYVYGAWSAIVGESYLTMRYCSALIASGIGVQILLLLRGVVRIPLLVLAALLYISSNFVFPWYATVQTYVLPIFFLNAAFLLLLRKEVSPKALFISGLCIGIAAMTRLYFLGFLPLLLVVCSQTRKGGWFLFGALCPLLLLFLIAPGDVLWFNNIGYHLLRSDASFSQALAQKWHVLEVLFGIRESVKFDGWQYPILLITATLSTILFARREARIRYAALGCFGLFAMSLLPSPVYVQYFCVTLPFLIVLLVYGLEQLLKRTRVWGVIVTLVLTCIYLIPVRSDLTRYTTSGEGVIGINHQRNAATWSLKTQREVSALLSERVRSGKEIASLWPGYLVGSDRVITLGLENHFGFLVADKITEDERRRYHLLSKGELQEKLKQREIPYFLSWRRTIRSGFKQALQEGGYRKIGSVGEVHLFSAQ